MKAAQFVIRDKDGQPIGIAKMHLREEPDGRGVLVINANKTLYLNKSATDHVRLILQNVGTEESIDQLAAKYKVRRGEVKKYHEQILLALDVLAKTNDIDPGILGIEREVPYGVEVSAPMRVDLALTYRCQNKCRHCYAGCARQMEEMTTEQWINAMQKIEEAQIPQVSFTGGECTLRKDLVELVTKAQDMGLVSGLITNGRRLSDLEYVKRLYRAGLDFVQITLESNRKDIHEAITCAPGSFEQTVQGIKNCLEVGLYTTTNTTLCPLNVDHALELVEFLHDIGLQNFAMNALIYSGRGKEVEKEFSVPYNVLGSTLDEVKHAAHYYGMNFIWYSPTRYCEINPVKMGLGLKTCSACRMNMAIEPDGTVLPCQSWYKSVGNILTDPWEKIWNHELCQSIRKRSWMKNAKGANGESCAECNWSQMCGAACPLEADKKRILHTECTIS
jgi:radical SAM protein with 4Fe4S-binding SPASM domain